MQKSDGEDPLPQKFSEKGDRTAGRAGEIPQQKDKPLPLKTQNRRYVALRVVAVCSEQNDTKRGE